MNLIDLKQTELYSTELTELHQFISNEADKGAVIQTNLKESDIFSLHQDENYANALKRIVSFMKCNTNNILSDVVKITSIKSDFLTYESIVANIFIADIMLNFYVQCGWMEQLTEKLVEKLITRLKVIGDDIKQIKEDTVYDIAYKTMISQWSILVKLLCIEKHFKTIWSNFFGYWKDPNTENFGTRVKLLSYLTFSKSETNDAKIVDSVLKTIALSIKAAKKIEIKSDLMLLLESLLFSLPEGSFIKEITSLRPIISPFFNKSPQMENHAARFEAICQIKTNLSDIQSAQKYMNGLNEINAKSDPILNYIEALCCGISENNSIYLPDPICSLSNEAKKRISPYRILPLKKYEEQYIQTILSVVVNCPSKIEKEEIERRATQIVFCVAHSLPISYKIIDSLFEDKEDYPSLSVLYRSLQLIVEDNFLYINVDTNKSFNIKKKILSLGKKKFHELYTTIYGIIKQSDSCTTQQRQISIPDHIKQFMAFKSTSDTFIKTTMLQATNRWKEIQTGKVGSIELKKIREIELEIVKTLSGWGNGIKIQGIIEGVSVIKKLLVSEIPDYLKNTKEEIIDNKSNEKKKKIVKDDKSKDKLTNELILFVQLIKYVSNYPKLYIISTNKLQAPSFFSFITSKNDYLANNVMESIFIMVYNDEVYRTLVVWELMKVFVNMIEADIPYQCMMEFVDSIMCLWTVKRISESTKKIEIVSKKKKNKEKIKPTTLFTSHLSEYIEAIITILQQRFDQSVRIQTPELFSFLYFTSLKSFDNTVWKVIHDNENYIGQISRYWFILMSINIPDCLLNINKSIPLITQKHIQVINDHLLSMDYLQTFIILKLLRDNDGTYSVTERVFKIIKKQLNAMELNNNTKYRYLNIFFSTIFLKGIKNVSNIELQKLFTLDNPDFIKIGQEVTPILKILLKDLIENVEDEENYKLISLLSNIHQETFYYFIEQVKSYSLVLLFSDKIPIEKKRIYMLLLSKIISNNLMRDFSILFSSDIANKIILVIISFINEMFLQVKLLWSSYVPSNSDDYKASINFPAFFTQNFLNLLYYFSKNLQKPPIIQLEKPNCSILPISLELHFLIWPLDQRTELCYYIINTFINQQMKTLPITELICSTAIQAINSIFSIAPLSLSDKFFIKPKKIIELEKIYKGTLKWIIRFHPDIIFSPKNPEIENYLHSSSIIQAISNVYSKTCVIEYNQTGVDFIEKKRIEFFNNIEIENVIEDDITFIKNLQQYGSSLLHHSLVTLMSDDEYTRICSFNVISWLLPIKFGLSNTFDNKIYDQIIKYRLSILSSIEQIRIVAAKEIESICVKYCEKHAKVVFYKGILAASGEKLDIFQKSWLVTYLINWLPFVNLSEDFNSNEINKILDILVYELTESLKQNSNSIISFWNQFCTKKNNNDKSNYSIIFNYLKNELPKAKNRDSFLIVFQSLMKIDLKNTFTQISSALSLNYSKSMMISRGLNQEKFKGQYIAMSVLNDFFGQGILVEDSGIHYMIVFSLLIMYSDSDKKNVYVFFEFIQKLCYNFCDSLSSENDPEIRSYKNIFYKLIVNLEISPIINQNTILEICITICKLLHIQKKKKLLSLIKREFVEWVCAGDPNSLNIQNSIDAAKFYSSIHNIGDIEGVVDIFVKTIINLKNSIFYEFEEYDNLNTNTSIEYLLEIINISNQFILTETNLRSMVNVLWVIICFLISNNIPIIIYRKALTLLHFFTSHPSWIKLTMETFKTDFVNITNKNPTMFKGALLMSLRGLIDEESKDLSADIFVNILSNPVIFYIDFPKKPEAVIPLSIISFTIWFCDKITNIKIRASDDWHLPSNILKKFIDNIEKLHDPKLKDYINYCKELIQLNIKDISITDLLKNILELLTPIISNNFSLITQILFSECIRQETSDIFKDIFIKFVIFFAQRTELKDSFVEIIFQKREFIKDNSYVYDLYEIISKNSLEHEDLFDLSYYETSKIIDYIGFHLFGIEIETTNNSSRDSISSEFVSSGDKNSRKDGTVIKSIKKK